MEIYLASIYLLEDPDNSVYEEDIGVFVSHEKAVEAAIKKLAKVNASSHSYDYWIRSFEVQA